jgi:hypothetical protein
VLRNEWKAHGLHLVTSVTDIARLENESQAEWQQRAIFAKFFTSFFGFVRTYTHVICYIMACVAHAVCGGLVTLPLPAMVFFWATLSSPRPPKIFWVIMITYTEFVILVRFIFRFNLYPWNNGGANSDNDPFFWPDVVGIHKEHTVYWVEIVFLICLFVHRYNLCSVGLWDEANAVDTFADAQDNSRRQSLTSTENVCMVPDVQSTVVSFYDTFCQLTSHFSPKMPSLLL